jgi:mono/diheme cytochrome c family protein
MKRTTLLVALAALALPILLAGCRGMVSERPPIHLQQNMDQQTRVDPQEPADLWADGRSVRPLVAGTVLSADPRGDADPCVLPEANPHYCQGKTDAGGWATALPSEITLDAALLDRGQERYDIFCAPCHDRVGAADGMVARRGMKPITFHQDIVRSREVGKMYDTIATGGAIMPPYASQIPVDDRWAIAAYVRALQISQHASLEVVPDDIASEKGWR